MKTGIKGKITLFVYIFIVCLGISFCCNIDTVYAQDDMDLFEEMDEKPKKKKKKKKSSGKEEDLFDSMDSDDDLDSDDEDDKKKSGILGKIVDNFEGSIKARYHYFPTKAEERQGLDDNLHFGEVFFDFKTWTGNETIQLHTSGMVQAGTQEDSYRGGTKWFQDDEYYRRYFDCNELYFLILTDSVDITLGKKKFNTGISTLFSPSDRFKPGDAHDPLDPKQFGVWMGKVDFSFRDGNFTFMVIPIHTEKKIPAPGSRWWGDRDLNDPGVTGTGNAENRDVDIEWRNVDVFGRYKKTISGWDFFVSMNSGPNPYDVIKQVGATYYRVKNRIYTLASGFSTTVGSMEYHGEALFNYSEGKKDDDYVSSVIGFTYTIDDWAKKLLLEQIILTVEYAGEIKFHNQSADDYVESSDEGRAGQNDLLVKIDLKYNEDLKFYLGANVDFDTKSWMNHYEIEYKIREGLVWSLAYQLFDYDRSEDSDSGGNSFDSVSYRDWADNDRIVTYLKYSF